MRERHPVAHRREQRYLSGPQSRLFEFAHAVRIFGEYFRGIRTLHFVGPCITVFGSARLGEGSPEYDTGRAMGAALATAGFTVMTGGGPGLMEAANRGAQDAGGVSVGCDIRLPHRQPSNTYVDRHITFNHFFIRKVMLVKYSVGFVALPGGYGTLDELFEVANLITTEKIHDFPIVLLGSEFWSPLIETLRAGLVGRGTLRPAELAHLHVTDSLDDAIEHIRAEIAAVPKARALARRWWLGERSRRGLQD